MEKPTDIPEGYELTGEYRQPKEGELYWDNELAATFTALFDFQINGHWILRKVETETESGPTDIPEGYELTGDYRYPKKGEHYLEEDGYGQCMVCTAPWNFEIAECWILRKVETKSSLEEKDPSSHYSKFKYTVKCPCCEEKHTVKLDPYRLASILDLGGGPREHIFKKCVRGTEKGHTERELATEILKAATRWLEIIDEDEQNDKTN